MISDRSAAAAWDAEYQAGRYADEPPVPFTRDIVTAARAAGITAGLYIGCGNGRNYLPLAAAGLDLTGLDISAAAIAQLTVRAPQRRHQLIHGDLTTLPAGTRYPLVIGIQVFQHGGPPGRSVMGARSLRKTWRISPDWDTTRATGNPMTVVKRTSCYPRSASVALSGSKSRLRL